MKMIWWWNENLKLYTNIKILQHKNEGKETLPYNMASYNSLHSFFFSIFHPHSPYSPSAMCTSMYTLNGKEENIQTLFTISIYFSTTILVQSYNPCTYFKNELHYYTLFLVPSPHFMVQDTPVSPKVFQCSYIYYNRELMYSEVWWCLKKTKKIECHIHI